MFPCTRTVQWDGCKTDWCAFFGEPTPATAIAQNGNELRNIRFSIRRASCDIFLAADEFSVRPELDRSPVGTLYTWGFCLNRTSERDLRGNHLKKRYFLKARFGSSTVPRPVTVNKPHDFSEFSQESKTYQKVFSGFKIKKKILFLFLYNFNMHSPEVH